MSATRIEAGESVVSVRGLHKRYGSTVAVESVDFDVPRGAVFGLLGPNGAGKSTTLGILCGWLRASQGSATMLGRPCHALYALRGRVASLPQDAGFPPQIAVGEQLAHFARLQGFSSSAARKEAERALDLVDLRDAAAMRGLELSHGMLKRVGLAQALMGSPEVVILDEPTAGLDPKNARRIKDLIASLAPERTVLVSSHNLADIQEICSHGLILDRGRVVALGDIAALTRRGAEITIEFAAGAELPSAALVARFGQDQVEMREGSLRIRFASEEETAEVIADALRLLLDANTPILGVDRGTSLEKTFLEITS
ncbi:MAG: ABC transporter ATP-binding protein [Deltaproteobacteria bacterium]|nr:ABC transporter ATP-binding protein [Deltaproteobacteria bacterium]MBW2421339.1 ABC transporter ATP-binding protein [Deltaproteobacteria bacterium]